MLKAGDLARREDRRVKGVKIGRSRRNRGISHVCPEVKIFVLELDWSSNVSKSAEEEELVDQAIFELGFK